MLGAMEINNTGPPAMCDENYCWLNEEVASRANWKNFHQKKKIIASSS